MTTSQTNLYHLTIREAAGLLKSGQLSPVELTQAFLDRIAATDDRLHSYITVLKEQALDDARLAEAEIRRGDYKGPLHGIPYALKDLYDTAESGRRHSLRQVGDARVRSGRARLHHALPSGPQPLEPGPYHRRLQ